jgi:opacity protein-like surface antigen
MESMRKATIAVLSAAILALTAATGSAQDETQDERRIHVNLGGGPTFNLGHIGDHFSTGWGPAVGLSYDLNPRFSVQAEYAYRYFRLNDSAGLPVGATAFGANHQTHQIAVDVIANLTDPSSQIRGYAIAGPGMYYRKVDITQYVGNGIICDPFWYVCGAYPIESVIGSRGGWDFGINFGGGIAFKFEDSLEFFIESRYHYVWGPKYPSTVLPSGQVLGGGSTNGQYWPLTFGIRF